MELSLKSYLGEIFPLKNFHPAVLFAKPPATSAPAAGQANVRSPAQRSGVLYTQAPKRTAMCLSGKYRQLTELFLSQWSKESKYPIPEGRELCPGRLLIG